MNVKKLTLILTACALMVAANMAAAQGKIAVYNLQGALLNTDVVQSKLKELEKKPDFAEMKAKYDAIVADMQKLDQEQKTEGVTWSAEQKAEHRKKIDYLRADLELQAKKLQDAQTSSIQGLVQELARKANQEVIPDLIKSEGIGLVIKAEAVQYADSAYDITAKITERLNKAE